MSISSSIAGGIIDIGLVKVVLTQAEAADSIIIDMFPEYYDFAYRFLGFNFVYPGLYQSGSFTIENHTGKTYRVTDYMFQTDAVGFQRTYNGMAQAMGLSPAQVAALPADEWYQLNVDYYGEENLNDLDTLRRLFGHGMTGAGSAGGYGVNVGPEASPGMIELAKQYLYRQCQFSFDIEAFPVSGSALSGEAVTLWDYINKTAENQDIVLNRIFSLPIGPEGFSSAIGYTNDYNGIGNVCNGAYVDFMFTLTLNTLTADIVMIHYDGNHNTGGAVPVDENSYTVGDSATVLGNTGGLTRAGYRFSGWNTMPDGSGAAFAPGDTIVLSSDVTLYALWTEQPVPPPVKPCCPGSCTCRADTACRKMVICRPNCYATGSPGDPDRCMRWVRCYVSPPYHLFRRRRQGRI